MDRSRIVVGVDGSAAGTAAGGGRSSATRDRTAHLDGLSLADARHALLGQRFNATRCRPATAAIVDAAVAEARTITPNVTVRGAGAVGYPAPVLLKAAQDAELMVVGRRGGGGFGGLLLGSVSFQVATHASCSVAVVRGRANTATGPIVVGVDGSRSAEAAAGLAFKEAALRRHDTLMAVTAYPAPLPQATVDPPPADHDDVDTIEADLFRDLTGRLADRRDKHPDLAMDCEVVNGGAAEVLVERSRYAQLVVVGARSRRGFEGLPLGSVGLHLLHHADCPVLIARACR